MVNFLSFACFLFGRALFRLGLYIFHVNFENLCRKACGEKCFAVLHSANAAYKLKIKEALHIMWEGPNLDKQLHHYNISLNL